MSYLNPETGSYEGFDDELAHDLAKALEVEIEYVPTTWSTLMDDTLDGKFDLRHHRNRNKKRAGTYVKRVFRQRQDHPYSC